MDNELQELHSQLEDMLANADEHNFDVEALDHVLARLDELDPLPKGSKALDAEAGLKLFHYLLRARGKWRYSTFYDMVVSEIDNLKNQDISDYRTVMALAACYELQEYLAGQLAQYAGEVDY